MLHRFYTPNSESRANFKHPREKVITALTCSINYFPMAGNRMQKPHHVIVMGHFVINSRRRPTLPHSYPCSTIGPEGLNFRVRDGNGCDPLGIATEKTFRLRLRRILGVAFVANRSTYLEVRQALCQSFALRMHRMLCRKLSFQLHICDLQIG